MKQPQVICLKRMVISLHLLCWLCGAFVVAFGELQLMRSRFASLVPSFWPIYYTNTLVVTGSISTCVCYLGVMGGMKENRCLLVTFYILLSILMLVELAMACVFFVYGREIDTYFEKDLRSSLEFHRIGAEDNKDLRDDFDAVQNLFQCCGVHGEADWNGSVPISCCVKDPCNSSDRLNWTEGCLGKLKDWFSHNYLRTASGVVTMFIIQFLCLSISLPLFCHLKQQRLGYQ